jgi:hypothetical protein
MLPAFKITTVILKAAKNGIPASIILNKKKETKFINYLKVKMSINFYKLLCDSKNHKNHIAFI